MNNPFLYLAGVVILAIIGGFLYVFPLNSLPVNSIQPSFSGNEKSASSTEPQTSSGETSIKKDSLSPENVPDDKASNIFPNLNFEERNGRKNRGGRNGGGLISGSVYQKTSPTSFVLFSGRGSFTVVMNSNTKIIDRRGNAIPMEYVNVPHQVSVEGILNGSIIEASVVENNSLPTFGDMDVGK